MTEPKPMSVPNGEEAHAFFEGFGYSNTSATVLRTIWESRGAGEQAAWNALASEIATRAQASQRAEIERLRGAASSGLAAVDKAYEECPINSTQRHIEECPKCGATEGDSCSLWIRASSNLEAAIRAALAETPPLE